MYDQNDTTLQTVEDLKSKLSNLIKAIEERTDELDYPLYCF